MTNENPPQPTTAPELLSVAEFTKHHHPPINLRWAIQQHYSEMAECGVVLRFGRKILIDPGAFWTWLRQKGRAA